MKYRRRLALLLASATAACQDSSMPNPSAGLTQVEATYLCGNDFELQSHSPGRLVLQYRVIGTPEAGELSIPAASEGAAGSTRLTTLTSGDLTISYLGETSQPSPNLGIACPPPSAASDTRASTGEWSAPFSWPVVAVHLHLLPSGRVLSWGWLGEPTGWDPASGEFVTLPTTTHPFCGGHSFLPDGRLLVTGGHLSEDRGLPEATLFDPLAGTWTPVEPMRRGRWYPTSTTLPDGEVVTLAGRDQDGLEVETPEVWTGSSWRSLPAAARDLPYYPRTFVAPNGLVFYAGELPETGYLDPTGAGSWAPVGRSNYGRREYGSAVMYRPGKVLIVGGSDPPGGTPTNTAEIIDLNQPSPSWRYSDPMRYPRRHLNATMLPDGTVLVTGGTSSAGFTNPAGAVHGAELWDPATGKWQLLAGNSVNRVYHSSTILLPDGRLLHAGSGDGGGLPRELNAELFSPPYLFRGPRPSVISTPAVVGYGQEFLLPTDDAPQAVRVTITRLSSVTHAFDQSQRFVELPLRRIAGGLMVTAPSSGAIAPPGPYMLFVLNSAGVPSIGRILRVG